MCVLEDEGDHVLSEQKHHEPDVGPFFAEQLPKFIPELKQEHVSVYFLHQFLMQSCGRHYCHSLVWSFA